MLEEEILKTRKGIRGEEERYVFDAFLLPLRELGLTEQQERRWIADAGRFAGRVDRGSYHAVRRSFLELAGVLLKDAGMSDSELESCREKMYIGFMEGRIRFFLEQEKREKSDLPVVEVGSADMHNADLALVFAHLREDPETAAFLERLDVRWAYEQLHMVTWFASQVTAEKRFHTRTQPNHSARVTYGRLMNPESVIWIAASLGEDRKLIRQAVSAAGSRKTLQEKTVILRNFIPFTRIYRLALPLVEHADD